jgi:hypothetical protein
MRQRATQGARKYRYRINSKSGIHIVARIVQFTRDSKSHEVAGTCLRIFVLAIAFSMCRDVKDVLGGIGRADIDHPRFEGFKEAKKRTLVEFCRVLVVMS